MLKLWAIAAVVFATVHGGLLAPEKRDTAPDGFSRVGPSPGDKILNLRLALTPNNIDGLYDSVYDVSTPGSPRYGQYLSKGEVEKFVAPSADTTTQVGAWLASNNITSLPLTAAGEWISVNLTVDQANQLLSTEFSTFRNMETNHTVERAPSYSIPNTLKTSIKSIYPIVTFPVATVSAGNNTATTAGPNRPVASVSAVCRSNSKLYGIPSTPAKPAANVLGVSGFENDFANNHDLKSFLPQFRPDINPNTTFDIISIDGGVNNQLPIGAGFFATFSIQNTIGLATGVSVAFISTGTLVSDDLYTAYLDQANYLLSLANPPQTVVNTYADFATATMSESHISPQVAESICNAYAQLAARGVSYIVASGDFGSGVPGFPVSGNCTPFDASFPATCPFVTAVGGTEFTEAEDAEAAWTSSGGGFSNVFQRPKYQDAAVEAYFRTVGANTSSPFNVSGRAVPDLSAINLGLGYFFGDLFELGSTAISASIFASMVALLTNERIAAGKPGLGFLNPLIYQNPAAFNDIVTGFNTGCQELGFNATTGWDPVTGFGSPSYVKLQEISNQL
ncbi:family S53 protease [Mycena olivaceomarginata]|nr:family S53 protease [Mycena olivaceomarginata]